MSLKNAGFPVNDFWDGTGDTHIAIDPIDQIEHATAEERADYVIDNSHSILETKKDFLTVLHELEVT
jgi:hypothetical protein